MDLIGDGVRVEPWRGRGAGVLLGEDRLPRTHIEEAHLHANRVGIGLLHGAEDDGVGAELAPRGKRNLFGGARGGDRGVRVPRNHIELALEVEVVPQHLAESLCDLGCIR